jgi:hypothetical protein
LVSDDSTPEDSTPEDSKSDDPAPDVRKTDDPKADGAKPGDANAPPPPAPAGARPRAFPLAKVIISAVGISVGVWVWLGSAWRWDVTPLDLAEASPPMVLGAWPGRYVRLVGARESGRPAVEDPASGSVFLAYVDAEGRAALVKRAADGPAPEGPVSGRVVALNIGDATARVVVDATRGRLNAPAALSLVIVLWGLAHAGANVYVWRRQRAVASREA